MKNENGPPKPDPKQTLNTIKQSLGKTPTSRLLMGVGSGWLAGAITIRAGRVPVVILGTSIILFQVAQNQGFIKHTWKDVSSKATDMKEGNKSVLHNAKQFATDNPAFAAGFTGGFLLGLAC